MAENIDDVFRDWNVLGDPASGEYEPEKPRIRALLWQMQATSGQSVTRNTLAQLNAVTPPTENYGGVVLNDPDPANNGYYARVSGAWVRGRGFPDTFAEGVLSGSGSAQVASFDTGINPADIEVFWSRVATENTGPMTLNGKPVVSVAGNPLVPGEWAGVVLYVDEGPNWRLLIDVNAAQIASQAASDAAIDAGRAEDAADRAEAAASGVEFPVSYAPQTLTPEQQAQARENIGVIGDGSSPVYQSISDLTSKEIPPHGAVVTLSEDGEPGSDNIWLDQGDVDPEIPGQIEVDVEGVTHFYTRSNKVLRPQQYGAKSGGDPVVNRGAIMAMFEDSARTGRTIDMGSANDVYRISEEITHSHSGSTLVVRGDGATIQLDPDGARQVYGLRVFTEGMAADLEGFNIDGMEMAPNLLWIENTTDIHEQIRLAHVGASRSLRAAISDYAGRAINVRGAYSEAIAEALEIRDVRMNAGAFTPGTDGICGLFIGRGVGNFAPMDIVVKDTIISNVTSYGTELIDQDGMRLFATDVSTDSSQKRRTVTVTGGKITNVRTRGIKFQAFNPLVHGVRFETTDTLTDGNLTGNCWVDFQYGTGFASDCVGWIASGAGWHSAIGGTARVTIPGEIVAENCHVSAAGTPKYPMAAFLSRYGDSGHARGSVSVRGCSADNFNAAVDAIGLMHTGRNDEVLRVQDNFFPGVNQSAGRFTGPSGNLVTLLVRGNITMSANNVPRLTTAGPTATVIGAVGDNVGFL